MIIRFVRTTAILFLLSSIFTGCQPSEVTSARLYLKNNNIERATEQLEIAKKNYPNNPEVFFLLGATYGRLHRYAEMNDAFETALRISDKHRTEITSIREFYWTRYYDEGTKAFVNKEYEQAVASLTTAIVIDSTQTRAQKKLAIVYVDMGKLESGLRLYEKLLSSTPDDIDLLGSAANLYYNLGEYDHVVDVLGRMLIIEPEHPDALANLAMTYEKLGQNEKADQAFRRAVAANPEDTDLLYLHAVHNYKCNNFAVAIELFKRVLHDRPRDFESLSSIGNCYLSLGRARRLELQQARDKQVSMQGVQSLRAMALQDYADAIPFFERARDIRPENAVVWKNLSIAYLAIGEKDKGSEAFQRAEYLQGSR